MRAAFRYVTQRPWTRIPPVTRTAMLNPVLTCLAGGRNKMLAAKAYDLLSAELAPTGLVVRTPETIWDVALAEVPLWVQRMGGVAVVKVPYSNAGQGVYTIASQADQPGGRRPRPGRLRVGAAVRRRGGGGRRQAHPAGRQAAGDRRPGRRRPPDPRRRRLPQQRARGWDPGPLPADGGDARAGRTGRSAPGGGRALPRRARRHRLGGRGGQRWAPGGLYDAERLTGVDFIGAIVGEIAALSWSSTATATAEDGG